MTSLKSNDKIYDGDDLSSSQRKKYNFFGSLVLKNKNIPFGQGVYLGKNYFLTVASNIYSYRLNPSQIQVQFNKSKFNSKGLVYIITRILVHPNYNPETKDYNLAILRLNAYPSSKSIKAISLPSLLNQNLYNYGYKNTIIGYGFEEEHEYNHDGSISHPEDLKGAIVWNVLPKDTNFWYKSVTSRMLIAANFTDHDDAWDNGNEFCDSDRGAPLFCNCGTKIILVGLNSWGPGCAMDGFPVVYSNILSMIDWIKLNTS